MYIEQFNLKEFPFRSSPDSRFLYLSDQVNEVFNKCLYMVTNAIGPMYVHGHIGTGKTTLAKRLHERLQQDNSRFLVAYLIIPPQLTVNGLLRIVMEEFGVKTERSYEACLKSFANWLIEQHQKGIKPVLVLDEAQNLTPTHLKLVHFLLNYETSNEKLLQLILFGQTQLAQKIEHFPELKSRMYPAALMALNRSDTEAMIEFRWYVAGGGKTTLPFSAEVLDEIFKCTLGSPRTIVKVCDMALLRAFSFQRNQVLPADIESAAKELELEQD